MTCAVIRRRFDNNTYFYGTTQITKSTFNVTFPHVNRVSFCGEKNLISEIRRRNNFIAFAITYIIKWFLFWKKSSVGVIACVSTGYVFVEFDFAPKTFKCTATTI